ncbi:MAG: hypothetical protein LBR40_00570 [Bacilli bacterium]|jgi:diaminopimelate epimerase|nr:hypothetical protein [Bacilli bacterium]
MELKIVIANPAGNITAFVLNKIEEKDYQVIAQRIMALPKLKVEQVGFVKNLTYEPYEMDMMGLEFCGNATRCFGYLAYRANKLNKDDINVNVSGAKKILTVHVDNNPPRSTVEIDKPEKIIEIEYKKKIHPLVVMEGISHLIIEDEEVNTLKISELLDILDEKYPNDAYGILYYHDNRIDPHVYVKATNSLVNESSCGSGAIAVGYYLHHNDQDGFHRNSFTFKGGTIETTMVIKDKECKCFMGGIISISDEMIITI